MNALAQVLLAQGFRVSGSDRLVDQGEDNAIIRKLHSAGVAIFPQDGSAVSGDLVALGYSTAIEDENPELAAAEAMGVPVVHRARLLFKCLSGMRCIAVGGTAGKSTITGMLGWIFERLGLDPTVVNGAPLLDWIDTNRIGNVRIGASNIAIVEADESDRSFLELEPDLAVISNMSRDHFDLPETRELFGAFARKSRRTVVCGPAVSLGDLGVQNLCKANFDSLPGGDEFECCGHRYGIRLPGLHNLDNALVAAVVCEQFGLDHHAVGQALRKFAGIERRLQVVGTTDGKTIVDDYAHNPAKIAAAWSTMGERAQRVLGIWRPHGFKPLFSMQEDLIAILQETLSPKDRFYVLPVYYAGGTAECRISAKDFVNALRQAGVKASFAEDYDALHQELRDVARTGDCILCMGARDPQIPRFAARLAEE